MIVREADDSDIPDLLKASEAFIEESFYGWTYSLQVAERRWREYIEAEKAVVLVAVDDNRMFGGMILMHDRDFTLERVGYIVKFYVFPEWRHTRAAILLVKAACKWFDEHLCWDTFATSTANIGEREMRAYTKLMKRFGFVECGPTLKRTANHG